MKKTIQLSFLLVFLSITSLIHPVNAQDATKELTSFTKKFEEACNKKDVKAIKELFTKDAVRSDPDGQTQTGNDAIAAAYEALFQNKLAVTITQEKVITENNTTLSTGTYRASGSTASGDSFDVQGTFIHTMVKEDGKWKISKQDLRSL